MDQELNTRTEKNKTAPLCTQTDKDKSRQWEKPVLEDVSGKIMAQPYIRFT